MEVKATLVERTSSKGNKYTAIEISITDKVKKLVFLNDSELELLKLSQSNDVTEIESNTFPWSK